MKYRIEKHLWSWDNRKEVRAWLVENFGAHGDKWHEEDDNGYIDLVMDEDVYLMYKLRWQ